MPRPYTNCYWPLLAQFVNWPRNAQEIWLSDNLKTRISALCWLMNRHNAILWSNLDYFSTIGSYIFNSCKELECNMIQIIWIIITWTKIVISVLESIAHTFHLQAIFNHHLICLIKYYLLSYKFIVGLKFWQ